MFTLFLTSSPCGNDGEVFVKNGLREELLRQVPQGARGLYITASPDDREGSMHASGSIRNAFERAGLHFSSWFLLDRSNQERTAYLVENSDFIVLGGGHVPTQHRFFLDIFLRQYLLSYEGVLLTISAGSMNCADMVYSIPEYPGEVIDPNYQRFFPGLGLTSVQILPHFYSWKGVKLDGQDIYREVASGNSRQRRFYVFPDGTYLFSKYGYEEIRGECHILENGVFRTLCDDEQKVLLPVI